MEHIHASGANRLEAGGILTELSTDRKIGIYAPSGAGKTYLADKIAASCGVKFLVYDTDYEATNKGYFKSPNVDIFTPEYSRAEDLDYLNAWLEVRTAQTSNVMIYVEDLDVFFDKGNTSMGKEARMLKNLSSKGRHHRVGFIYCTKQMAYIPTKVRSNTNLFYIGKFTTANEVETLRGIVSYDEMAQLGEHEFWKVDMLTHEKKIIKV